MDPKISIAIEAVLSALAGDKTAEEISKLHDDVKAIFDELTTTVEDTLSANESLSAEIEKLAKAASESVVKKVEEKVINLAEHVFEFAGKKFGFNYPKLTISKDQVITPVEVVASKDLQKQLVDSNHSMIKQLPS